MREVTVALSVLRAMTRRVLNLNQTPKMTIRKSKLLPKLVFNNKLTRLSRYKGQAQKF